MKPMNYFQKMGKDFQWHSAFIGKWGDLYTDW